jgi:glutaredoxin-dependent peroxiredoxin
MPLQKGDRAPDFTLYDSATTPWTLSEHLQQSPVVLLFFPGAFTGVCTTELNTVNNDLSSYSDLGAQVVGLSTDSPFVLKEFSKSNALTYPLLSDHNAEVAAQYEAKYNRDFTGMGLDRIAKRSAFVIGTDGTIRYAEVLENAGELPDLDAVKAALGEGA